MTTTTHIDETVPNPPRYWWLKRIAISSVLLILAYIAVMKWWAYEAHRRLQAEIDAIHARGEPILVEDFAVKPVPDEHNAALSLIAASQAIVLTKSQRDSLDAFDFNIAIDSSQWKMLEQIANSNATARQLARSARFQPDIDWGIKIRSPATTVLLPALSPQRELADVLRDSALYKHSVGHDAEAIEIVRDLLRQSKALQQRSPFLVAHLVAIVVNELTYVSARGMSHDLQVLRENGATTLPTSAVSPRQVLALINELLDERAYLQGGIDAMYGERMLQYDTCVSPSGRASGAYYSLLPVLRDFTPMFELDAERMVQTMESTVSAISETNYPAAKAKMPDVLAMKTRRSVLNIFSHIMMMSMMPSLDRPVELHYRGLLQRRVAAIYLAVKLYQLDHDGSVPEKLLDLVPAYLPGVPIDPFASGEKPLSYRKAPIPMIYCVGLDGNDDGGNSSLSPKAARVLPDTAAPPGHPADRWNWERRDVIFPLSKPQPLPPPTDEN